MSLKFYEYKNCDTCKKAKKFLDSKNIAYEPLPIVDTPPTLAELKKMLEHLKADGHTYKNLFNTSGELYRSFNISEKIKTHQMTETHALQLLSQHGKLIKRPFVIDNKIGTVGFKEDLWQKLFKPSSSKS